VEEGSEDNQVPEVCVDYMYMTEKEEREEDRGMPILVVRDRRTKMAWPHVVPRKGKEGFAVRALARDLRLLGYLRVILKSDGEPSVMALKEAVRVESECEVVPEESPVGEHQSNGGAEAAVRVVQGQVRAMQDALESRLGKRMGGELLSPVAR
jgi:hypothetical protein